MGTYRTALVALVIVGVAVGMVLPASGSPILSSNAGMGGSADASVTLGGPTGASVTLGGPTDTSVTDDGTTAQPTADGGSTVSWDAQGDHCPAGRSHPDSDRLGFENGCWYDDPVDVDNSNGLNETELDAVVSRTMARIERIRQLEFTADVPVAVMSRAQFREETAGRFANVSTADRIHQNVKFEALFMVGEDTDAVADQESNAGTTVLGYYSPSQDRIVIVSENQTSPQMDELTLSHELAHALQDQHFDLSRFDRATEDENNAQSGLIEGDAHLVETLYNRRCDGGSWDCVTPTGGGGGGGGGDIHLGLYLLTIQPYSDGPYLVQQVKQEGGWAAVNDMYANPPESSEQVIHVEKYPGDEPTNVTVADRSNEDWEILELEGSIDYATFGEAGVYSMFLYPYFHSDRTTEIVPFEAFLNYKDDSNELQEIDPYDYAHRYSAGWDGDKLYPYVNGSWESDNETAYVWKLEWDSPEDAREFVEGYERVLRYYGASEVRGHDDTWRIDDSLPHGDAFWVNQTGSTVVIVNAPTVDALSDVRAGAAPVNESDLATPTATTAPPTTGPSTGEDPETASPTDGDGGSSGGVPGFGAGVTLLAVAAAAVALLGRRGRD